MRYFVTFVFLFICSNLSAEIKDEIKSTLEKTDSINFNFIQKINNKIEKGECRILFPKKIYCQYDDIYEKVLVSDGIFLIINSKSIKNYFRYKIEKTPLNLILDKKFLLKKINNIKEFDENEESYFIKILQNDNLINVYFDKKDFYMKGWSTLDIYQNKVETKLFKVKTNIIINDKIFNIQKYIN